MKQSSLFGQLKLPDAKKEKSKNKALLEKVNTSLVQMTQIVKANVNAQQANAMAKKLEIIKQTAKKYFVDDGSRLCIRTEAEFFDYINKIKKIKEAGIDSETTGLDPILDYVVGLCLYCPGQKPAYIPVHHTDLSGKLIPNQLPIEVIVEGLAMLDDVKWYFHNAKFDNRFMHNSWGIDYLPVWWDSDIAGNLLNENESHKLKDLYDKYIDNTKLATADGVATYSTVFDGIPFNYVPIEIGYLYAADDGIKTWKLGKFQEQFLDVKGKYCKEQGLYETAKLYREMEIPLINVLADNEDTGIAINEATSNMLKEKYNEKLYQTEMNIKEFFRKSIDVASIKPQLRQKLGAPADIMKSPAQLGIIIYDYFKLKSPKRKEPRGTGADIIESFVQSGKLTHEQKEFFRLLLEHRSLSKLIGTYIEKLPSVVKEKTKRLHATFKQYGAKTGRQSSSDPNLQNIPAKNKDIRKMFEPGKLQPFEYEYTGKYYSETTKKVMDILAYYKDSEWVIVSSDFSQQEPRTLAFISQDEGMIQAYREGKDLYAWIGSVVYKLDYWDCMEKHQNGMPNPEGKVRRDSMKSVVLGIMYSRGAEAIAEQLDIDKEEAQRIIDLFFESFPKVKALIEYYLNKARRDGYVTTVWGRKRRLPDLTLPKFEIKGEEGQEIDEDDARKWQVRLNQAKWNKEVNQIKKEAREMGYKVIDNRMKIADAERQVLNSVIQGTGADITKLAMVRLSESWELKELGYKILLSVHDEIIGKSPKENAIKAGKLMSEIMIAAAAEKITVPMKCDDTIEEVWSGGDISDTLVA